MCARGAVIVAALAAWGGGAGADEASRSPERATVDRVVVRFWAPETGGAARPRFITERTLAFEARLEALGESAVGPGPYQERHVRVAMERHVAEELLAELMIQRGVEPRDFAKRTERMGLAIADRVGGSAGLEDAMRAEGIDASELAKMERRAARAEMYVDAALQPILSPTEEELREVFRTGAHPFKGKKLDEPDVHEAFARWLVLERLRQAEGTFFQAARTRMKIVNVQGRRPS
jgi:hypothetical protein